MSSKSAARYAQSLLDYAIELNLLDQVKQDMQLISTTCAENRELELMLHSPVIKTDKKVSVFKAVFGKFIQEVTLKFLIIVTEKKREIQLLPIVKAFLSLYNLHNGIVAVQVTSAKPLTAQDQNEIVAALKGVNGKLEIESRVDPKILGGLQVRIGDQRIDASIRKKLSELKQELSK